MTVIYHDLQHKTNIAFMKGAPERVLDACIYDANGDKLTDEGKKSVLRLMDRFAAEGLVLSLAAALISESSCAGFQIVDG